MIEIPIITDGDPRRGFLRKNRRVATLLLEEEQTKPKKKRSKRKKSSRKSKKKSTRKKKSKSKKKRTKKKPTRKKSSGRRSKVPSMVRRYAERTAKMTGMPYKKVLNSEPVQNYWNRLVE